MNRCASCGVRLRFDNDEGDMCACGADLCVSCARNGKRCAACRGDIVLGGAPEAGDRVRETRKHAALPPLEG